MIATTAPTWQHLIGKPYRDFARGPDFYDCLGVSLEVQRGVGYEIGDPLDLYKDGLPGESFSDAWLEYWRPVKTPRLYDLALFRMPDQSGKLGWHVGCLVEPNRIIHATARCGVVTQRFDYFVERGYFKGWWRPRCGHAVKATDVEVPSEVPLVPAGAFGAGFLAGAGVFFANLAIGVLIGLIGQLIARPKKASFRNDPDRPSFDLSGPRNTVSPGTTIPVVYGEHPVGGQIIQLFQRADAEFRSRLYMLVCVSEGPVYSIGGFTSDVTNQPVSSVVGRNITINGNAIAGFPNCRISTRLGTSSQDPIPGFEETVISGSVNSQLKRTVAGSNNTSVIAENVDTITYTTSAEIDAFEANINFPGGLYKLDSAGNTQPYQWLGTLRYRRKGIPTSEVAEFITLGPSTLKSDHTRTIRRQNLTRDVYEISLTRSCLEDTNTTQRFSVSTWTTVNEINSSLTLAYPGRALLAVEALASDQLSGAIPQVASLVKGRLVWVWDGVSTTSPTFTQQWSNNPAWIALDVLMEKRFGMGHRVRLNEIDLQSFKDWADYCATTITTDGTSHARWEFNHVYDSTQRVNDVLAQIGAAGRASVIQIGSKWRAVVDQATTYSQVFTMGNITAGTLKRQIADLTDRPNVVELQYLNKDANYDQDVAQVTSLNSATAAVVKDSLRIIGITRAVQAYRAVKWSLNVSQTLREVISFQAHVEAIAVEPGNVFRFAHDQAQIGYSGRCPSVSAGGLGFIVADRRLVVAVGWKVLVRVTNQSTGAEQFVERTLTAGTYDPGTDIPVTVAFAADAYPTEGSVWMAGPSATYYKEYRVLGVRMGTDFMCDLTAIEYDADVYDDDPGVIEEFTDQWPSSLAIPDPVTSLSAREFTGARKDGTIDHMIDVGFIPTKAAAFDVWFRYADLDSTDTDPNIEAWEHAGTTRDGHLRFSIAAAYKRTVEISVTARGPGGALEDARRGVKTLCVIHGRTIEPAAPTSLVATLIDSKVLLTWTAPADADVDHYEIRASADSSRWLFAMPVMDNVKGTLAIVDPSLFGTAKYYLVKAVSRSGIPSFTAASVSVTPSSGGQVVILDASVVGGGTNDWTGGTLTNCSKVSGNLRTDANVSSATWQSATTTFPILSQQATIRCHLDAIGYDLTTTAIEAGYRFDSTYARRLRASGELIDIPWPEQSIAYGSDLSLPSTAPLASSMTMSGTPYPWSTNYRILIEYDLATDTGATSWDGWKTYTGPFEAKARYYVRWRLTFTISNAEFTIDATRLYVQITANGSVYTGRDDQIVIDDDLDNGSTESGEIGNSGLNTTGTSSTFAVITADENHWGVVSIATQATTGNFGGASTAQNIFYPNARTYAKLTAWVKPIDSASVAYYIGFARNTGSATPSRRIWVTASAGGNWSAQTTDASSTTTTNTGAPLSTNWWKLEIEIFGVSSVRFTLTDQGTGTSYTATHTTNIPTDLGLLLTFQVGNSTNAAKTLYLDRYRLVMSGLRRL